MKKLYHLTLVLICFSCSNKNAESAISVSNEEEKIVTPENYSSPETKQESLPFKIEGIYVVSKEENEDACDLTITISATNSGYNYSLKMPSFNKKGKMTLEPIENNKGFYFTLEGIEWSEYEGDISNQDEDSEEIKKDLEKPIGINGMISDGQIDIQNTGNAMNYYVQLSGCNEKFIHLKKQ